MCCHHMFTSRVKSYKPLCMKPQQCAYEQAPPVTSQQTHLNLSYQLLAVTMTTAKLNSSKHLNVVQLPLCALWRPSLLLQPTGEGAGQGDHICTKGHQEEARRGQQTRGAHPLGAEDPRRGSLAFRRQVSSNALCWNSAPLVWENRAPLISFWDQSWGPEQITSC